MPHKTVVIYAPPAYSRHAAPKRVRLALADLAEKVGRELQVKQTDIAAAAGCARETASRELAKLERAGITEQGHGRIAVRDLAALRAAS